jgi:hypothetical protein
VAQGNHQVETAQHDHLNCDVPTLTLAHFPARGIAQLQAKALAWEAYVAAGLAEAGMAAQWQRLHERLQRGGRWDEQDFYELARRYYPFDLVTDDVELVDDPFPLADAQPRYQEFSMAETTRSTSASLSAGDEGT